MQKTAVVTGGSRGIGLAITEKFLSEGYRVYVVSRGIGDLGSFMSQYSDSLVFLSADLSRKEEVMKVCGEIRSGIGQLDVLVNNAGQFLPGSVTEEEEGVFEFQMALNVGSAYHVTRALHSVLKEQESCVFNMCSTASIVPYLNGGSYCISKHALLGFSKVLREEFKERGIAVCSVLPGATYTDSWKGSGLPEDRFMKTSNIAEAIWTAWVNSKNCVMEEILIRPKLGDI